MMRRSVIRLDQNARRAITGGHRRRHRGRRPLRGCTHATRCGRRHCIPRSRVVAATPARCKSIGTQRWKCWPSTPSICTLLPLGELWVAAARIRQVDRLQHTIDQAFTLLESLGNPALSSVPLHWAGVHAGILANSPESVAPHGQALAGAAESVLARALSVAGRTWLHVLANHVDPNEVTTAARSLSHVGLTSDATRLAGQAALQTPDARVSGSMLQLARDLKLSATGGEAPDEEPLVDGRSTVRQPPPGSPLSDREREVAKLLLLGMPYREIGNQLFISAKTVEHHVARIRRRLGAGSRSEMLSLLRAMLTPQN